MNYFKLFIWLAYEAIPAIYEYLELNARVPLTQNTSETIHLTLLQKPPQERLLARLVGPVFLKPLKSCYVRLF